MAKHPEIKIEITIDGKKALNSLRRLQWKIFFTQILMWFKDLKYIFHRKRTYVYIDLFGKPKTISTRRPIVSQPNQL